MLLIYLPFPHYRGKVQKELFERLKENFEAKMKDEIGVCTGELNRYKDSLKRGVILSVSGMVAADWIPILERNIQVYSNVQLDMVDTEYGKMLKIYMPFFGGWNTVGYLEGCGEIEIHANIKTVVDDYKFTYEENLIPIRREEVPNKEKLAEIPIFERISRISESERQVKKEAKDLYKYYKESRIVTEYNIPVYAEFEGKELYIDLYGCLRYIYWHILEFDPPGGDTFLLYEFKGEPLYWFKDCKMVRLDPSGWQKVPLIKRKIWEKWDGQKRLKY